MMLFYIYNVLYGIVFAISLLIALISTKKLAGIRFVIAPIIAFVVNVVLGILLYTLLFIAFPGLFGITSDPGLGGVAIIIEYTHEIVFSSLTQSIWAVILLVWWDNRRKNLSV